MTLQLSLFDSRKSFEDRTKHLRTFPAPKGPNSHKIILSLFDLSLVWCQPYIDAGYTVLPLDIQADGLDIASMENPYLAGEIIGEMLGFPPYHVYGILNACPCTSFSGSGARWWKAKNESGETQESLNLLIKSMQIIKYFMHDPKTDRIAEFDATEALRLNPDAGLRFWALENPVGRINTLLPGMKKFGPQYFQPNDYGSPYTKKTGLWGSFNFPKATNRVEPTEGSRMWNMFPTKDPLVRKNARSRTDENFSNAFFEVNR